MQRYLTALARILLAQVFLLQITMLLIGLFRNPEGYQQYQVLHAPGPSEGAA